MSRLSRRQLLAAAAGTAALPLLDPAGAAAAPRIARRPLGRTGMQVSILGLGGGSQFLSACRTDEQAVELLNTAIDGGINYLDSAASYGNGESERRYGLQARVTPMRFEGGELTRRFRGVNYQVQRYFVDDAEVPGPGQGVRVAADADHATSRRPGLRGEGHRAPDQPHSDDGERVKEHGEIVVADGVRLPATPAALRSAGAARQTQWAPSRGQSHRQQLGGQDVESGAGPNDLDAATRRCLRPVAESNAAMTMLDRWIRPGRAARTCR